MSNVRLRIPQVLALHLVGPERFQDRSHLRKKVSFCLETQLSQLVLKSSVLEIAAATKILWECIHRIELARRRVDLCSFDGSSAEHGIERAISSLERDLKTCEINCVKIRTALGETIGKDPAMFETARQAAESAARAVSQPRFNIGQRLTLGEHLALILVRLGVIANIPCSHLLCRLIPFRLSSGEGHTVKAPQLSGERDPVEIAAMISAGCFDRLTGITAVLDWSLNRVSCSALHCQAANKPLADTVHFHVLRHAIEALERHQHTCRSVEATVQAGLLFHSPERQLAIEKAEVGRRARLFSTPLSPPNRALLARFFSTASTQRNLALITMHFAAGTILQFAPGFREQRIEVIQRVLLSAKSNECEAENVRRMLITLIQLNLVPGDTTCHPTRS